MSLIERELADILVCPVCHGDLDEHESERLLVCSGCGRSYPVDDQGIPHMIPTDSDE